MNFNKFKIPWFKYAVCILYIGILNAGVFLSENLSEKTVLEQLKLLLYQGELGEEGIVITQMLLCIMPIWLFVIFSSNGIVKGQNLERICLFVRYNRRSSWYWKNIGKMLLEIILFLVIYLGLYLWFAMFVSVNEWKWEDAPMFINICVVLGLYIFLHCVLGNVVRIFVKAEIVSIVMIVFLLAETLGVVLANHISIDIIRIINPLYYFLRFHEMEVAEYMVGMGNLVLLNCAAIWFGRYAVSRADVGLIEEEM